MHSRSATSVMDSSSKSRNTRTFCSRRGIRWISLRATAISSRFITSCSGSVLLRQLAPLSVAAVIVDVQERHASFDAKEHQALRLDDAQQPCGDPLATLTLIQVHIGFPVGFLHFILSFIAVPQDASGDVNAGRVVPSNQFGERVLVSTASPVQQFFVALRITS